MADTYLRYPTNAAMWRDRATLVLQSLVGGSILALVLSVVGGPERTTVLGHAGDALRFGWLIGLLFVLPAWWMLRPQWRMLWYWWRARPRRRVGPIDPDHPRLLANTPTEVEAVMLVARLDGVGVEAWVEGGISAGFRAEAPGSARVLVHGRDFERAVRVLRTERKPPRLPSHPPTKPGPIPRKRDGTLWVLLAIGLVAFLIWNAVAR